MVIRLILRSQQDKQIAAETGLSNYAVCAYLKRIFDRFDISDRTALVLRVLSNCRPSCPHDECPHK